MARQCGLVLTSLSPSFRFSVLWFDPYSGGSFPSWKQDGCSNSTLVAVSFLLPPAEALEPWCLPCLRWRLSLANHRGQGNAVCLGKGGGGRFPPPRKLGYSFCRNRGCWGGSVLCFFFFPFFFGHVCCYVAMFVATWPCLLLRGHVCCYVAMFVAMWASLVAACWLSSYCARSVSSLQWESSWIGDRTHVLCIGRWIHNHWTSKEVLSSDSC